mgnify:CR=1 FL=1
MRLQSAIFDMDGTLLDSMPIWRDLGTSVLRGLGIEPEPETDEMLKTLSLRHGIAYCKEHYHLPQTEEELIGRVVDRVADFYQHEVQAKPGVDKFLSLLKMEGVWMYVATATDRPLAEAASAMQGSTTTSGDLSLWRRWGSAKRRAPRSTSGPCAAFSPTRRTRWCLRTPSTPSRPPSRRVPGGGGVRRVRGGTPGGDPRAGGLLYPFL